MPQAIASHKDTPICEDVIRFHVGKPVNYAHVYSFLRRPRKEPGYEANTR